MVCAICAPVVILHIRARQGLQFEWVAIRCAFCLPEAPLCYSYFVEMGICLVGISLQ